MSFNLASPSNNQWWGSNDSNKTMSELEGRSGNDNHDFISGPNDGGQKTIATCNHNSHNHSITSNFDEPTMISQQQNIPPTSNTPYSSQSEREVIYGSVTQLFSNFGYIDDNIIFSISDVSGSMVKVGDKVEVHVTFQPNDPSKYKCTKLRKMPINSTLSDTNSKNKQSSRNTLQVLKSANNQKSNSHGKTQSNHESTPLINTKMSKKPDLLKERTEILKSKKQSRDLISFNIKTTALDLKHRSSAAKVTEEHDKLKDENIKVAKRSDTKSQPNLEKEPDKSKCISPFNIQKVTESDSRKRKIDSNIRYTMKYVESFAFREFDCAALKCQFRSLPLPTELFHISLKFQQSFPLNQPIKLGNMCSFKVMDKKTKPINEFINEELNRSVDPSDADTRFVAKVILMSSDDLTILYKHTLTLSEENSSDIKIPITKAIKFLVGSMGENKEFGIGGAWSPSLDGLDPTSNGRALINTAIRTCRSITGIDLSKCTSWPKFFELHYYRPLKQLHQKNINDEEVECREPRMETVVYYLPDVWNILPSQNSWNDIKKAYQEQLECCIYPSHAFTKISDSAATSSDLDKEDYEDSRMKEKNSTEKLNSAQQPTHFSKLSPASMKIADIKRELELRKLNSRGVMEQLKIRLKTILEREESEEKIKEDSLITKITAPSNVKFTTMSENERNELKKLYVLPEFPQIIIHQNTTYKDIKIKTMSLHSLLSYYDIKLEEDTFELAVFARQFFEMLRRDAVFIIYKSIVVAPEEDLVSKDNVSKKAKLTVTTSKRTINKPLLFYCTLLDRDKSNKISLDDLMMLIEGLGICLSSKQLSNVLAKVKDNSKYFHYRLLTDKIVTDGDISNMNMDVNEDLDYINELAIGNKALFDYEAMPMDTTTYDLEIERLNNELAKSERRRQNLESEVVKIKEDTGTNLNLWKSQSKEIEDLLSQGSEYENKYNKEKDRADQYKREFDKLLNEFKGFDKITKDIKNLVTKSVNKFTKSLERDYSLESADSMNTSISKKSIEENIISDLTENTHTQDKDSEHFSLEVNTSEDVGNVNDHYKSDIVDIIMGNEENVTETIISGEITSEVGVVRQNSDTTVSEDTSAF